MQYYSLVAGLRRLGVDDTPGADALMGIREQIAENLTRADRKTVALFDEWDEIALVEDLDEKRARFDDHYARVERSGSRFLREWSAFDKDLRNNLGASRTGGAIASSAPNPQVDAAALENILAEQNLVKKERAIDSLRWSRADELASGDYFGLPTVMAYLVKLKIASRWARLNPETGREMYHKLVVGIKNKQDGDTSHP